MANDFTNDPACLAVWNFESGALTVDSKGSNTWTNNGADENSSLFKQGSGAVDCDGAGTEHMSIAAANLDAAFPFKDDTTNNIVSITCWLYVRTWTHNTFVCAKGATNQQSWGLTIIQSGGQNTVLFGTSNNGINFNGARVLETSNAMVTGRWYHITSYYDGAQAYMCEVWDDVAQAKLVTFNETVHGNFGSSTPFLVGKSSFGLYADIIVDELTVWNKVLTSDECDQTRLGIFGNVGSADDPRMFLLPTTVTTRVGIPGTESTDFRIMSDPPELGVIEQLEWNTDVIKPKHSDEEQRIALRTRPRQSFTNVYAFNNIVRRRQFMAHLFKYLKKEWAVPVWTESEVHSGTLSSGSSSITVDTDYSDWRASSHGFIWESETNWEIIKVASFTTTVLTLDKNTINTYTKDKFVMPCRFGFIRGTPVILSEKSDITRVNVTFDTHDAVEITGYSAAQSLHSMEIMTRGAEIPGLEGISESHSTSAVRLDNNTGLIGIEERSEYNNVTQEHRMRFTTKANIWDFRQWMHSIDGPQKAFLVPTYLNDLALSRAVGSSDDTIFFTNIGLADHVQTIGMLKYFAFLNTDGTVNVKWIDSIATVSGTEESITLGSGATAGTAYATTAMVMFVWICRLSSDALELDWFQRNGIIANASFRRVVV